MEKGYYHNSIGYWQTTGQPSQIILDTYPEGTIEVPLRPNDGVYELQNEEWVKLSDNFAQLLKLHRDIYWQKPIMVGGVQVLASEEEKLRINCLIEQIKINDFNGTIQFTALNGNHDLGVAGLQGILKAIFLVEQKARNAYNTVAAIHNVTPYPDLQSMITAFESEVT